MVARVPRRISGTSQGSINVDSLSFRTKENIDLNATHTLHPKPIPLHLSSPIKVSTLKKWDHMSHKHKCCGGEKGRMASGPAVLEVHLAKPPLLQ